MRRFADWQEPVLRLAVENGEPLPEQRALADLLDLPIDAEEPRPVAAARLYDALAVSLECPDARPADPHALYVLQQLRGHRLRPLLSGLTQRVVAAWITHLESLRTMGALSRLQLERGDLVRYLKPSPAELLGSDRPRAGSEIHAVTAIGEDGRVWFAQNGTGSESAWPHRLELIASARDVAGT